jgi:hypothetical protein
MAYKSRWTSTDQVPERLIDSGQLSRFGSLNPTDGGKTQRMSLSGKWFDKGPEGETTISAYAIDYRFDLFSDFTYFLEQPGQRRPVRADRPPPRLRRAGGPHDADKFGGLDGLLSFGAQLARRPHRRGGPLRHAGAPAALATVRNDKVSQDLFSVYGQQLVNFSDRLARLRGRARRHAALRRATGASRCMARSTAARATIRSRAPRRAWPSR